jgi:hypothetical protein
MEYSNKGWSDEVTWTFHTDVSWLSFDIGSLVLSGIPRNDDVGKAEVWLTLRDTAGHKDEHNFIVRVKNTAPSLEWDNQTTVIQDESYNINFHSDDESLGDTEYHLATDAWWLSMDKYTGILTGIPTNAEVGIYWVRVWVTDGNEGENVLNFELSVSNKNDPPVILKTDITTVLQGENFRRDYDVEDMDEMDTHEWFLTTDASWLSIDNGTGLLSGIPGPEDVGSYSVDLQVVDSGGLSDSRSFIITVENVNDKPFFTKIPEDTSIISGRSFEFDVNASDHDEHDTLKFSISSLPVTDITINKHNGQIYWEASVDWFTKIPYRLDAEVVITDGELSNTHRFSIFVEITSPPLSTLISPPDGLKANYQNTQLEWEGHDPEGEDISYDIFIGETKVFVSSRKEETLFISGFNGLSIATDGLEPGKVYYWTVIPSDGSSMGVCSNGVFSFRLNSPPTLSSIGLQEGQVGVQFKLLLQGSDGDQEDQIDLVYSLVEGPEGLQVDQDTGLIKWKPRADQVMLHKVVVRVSDGTDDTDVSFTIDVKSNGVISSDQFVFASLIGVLILVIVLILAFVFFRIKRPKKKDGQINKVSEEQVIGSSDDEETPKVKCDVALSPTEAHAHLGKGSAAVSYEELYGSPAPKMEDKGMTTKELKNFIHEQINELEKMEE